MGHTWQLWPTWQVSKNILLARNHSRARCLDAVKQRTHHFGLVIQSRKLSYFSTVTNAICFKIYNISFPVLISQVLFFINRPRTTRAAICNLAPSAAAEIPESSWKGLRRRRRGRDTWDWPAVWHSERASERARQESKSSVGQGGSRGQRQCPKKSRSLVGPSESGERRRRRWWRLQKCFMVWFRRTRPGHSKDHPKAQPGCQPCYLPQKLLLIRTPN